MKKRSLKNLALNKQSISNFQSTLVGGAASDSKTGGCNTVSLILQCPADPIEVSRPPLLCPGDTVLNGCDSAVESIWCPID